MDICCTPSFKYAKLQRCACKHCACIDVQHDENYVRRLTVTSNTYTNRNFQHIKQRAQTQFMKLGLQS